MSKSFNVQDSLTTYNWKLGSETKQIGNYKCSKATTTILVNTDDVKDDDQASQKTNFTDTLSKQETVMITIWYTTEIPVNHGPESYWGLPGLILELNDGTTTILCSKITLNPKEKSAIQLPKGVLISKAAYDIIVLKKLDELKQGNNKLGN